MEFLPEKTCLQTRSYGENSERTRGERLGGKEGGKMGE